MEFGWQVARKIWMMVVYIGLLATDIQTTFHSNRLMVRAEFLTVYFNFIYLLVFELFQYQCSLEFLDWDSLHPIWTYSQTKRVVVFVAFVRFHAKCEVHVVCASRVQKWLFGYGYVASNTLAFRVPFLMYVVCSILATECKFPRVCRVMVRAWGRWQRAARAARARGASSARSTTSRSWPACAPRRVSAWL